MTKIGNICFLVDLLGFQALRDNFDLILFPTSLVELIINKAFLTKQELATY